MPRAQIDDVEKPNQRLQLTRYARHLPTAVLCNKIRCGWGLVKKRAFLFLIQFFRTIKRPFPLILIFLLSG